MYRRQTLVNSPFPREITRLTLDWRWATKGVTRWRSRLLSDFIGLAVGGERIIRLIIFISKLAVRILINNGHFLKTLTVPVRGTPGGSRPTFDPSVYFSDLDPDTTWVRNWVKFNFLGPSPRKLNFTQLPDSGSIWLPPCRRLIQSTPSNLI